MNYLLVLCPPGIIGTTIDGVEIVPNRAYNEPRGYAMVEESLARKLAKRDGYEIVPYPRDIEKLKKYSREEGTKRNHVLPLPSSNSATTANGGSTSKTVTADFASKPCFFCNVKAKLNGKKVVKTVALAAQTGSTTKSRLTYA